MTIISTTDPGGATHYKYIVTCSACGYSVIVVVARPTTVAEIAAASACPAHGTADLSGVYGGIVA